MSERPSLGPIDHVAVVVRSIDASLPRYAQLFGLAPEEPPRVIAAQGVKLCFLPTGPAPAARLELIEPVDPESGVARFLASRGEGLHHVCFGTPDLAAELAPPGRRRCRAHRRAPRARVPKARSPSSTPAPWTASSGSSSRRAIRREDR